MQYTGIIAGHIKYSGTVLDSSERKDYLNFILKLRFYWSVFRVLAINIISEKEMNENNQDGSIATGSWRFMQIAVFPVQAKGRLHPLHALSLVCALKILKWVKR